MTAFPFALAISADWIRSFEIIAFSFYSNLFSVKLEVVSMMSKKINLTQNQISIVDDEWFDEINQYKWYAVWNPPTKSFYAARNIQTKEGQKRILMHRVILNTPPEKFCDHKNHNTLDNQEHNLRNSTRSQNAMNKGKQSNNTSGYKGVFFNGHKWYARIGAGEKYIYLKTWNTPEEAARAYDEAAKMYHGEFAFLNFP